MKITTVDLHIQVIYKGSKWQKSPNLTSWCVQGPCLDMTLHKKLNTRFDLCFGLSLVCRFCYLVHGLPLPITAHKVPFCFLCLIIVVNRIIVNSYKLAAISSFLYFVLMMCLELHFLLLWFEFLRFYLLLFDVIPLSDLQSCRFMAFSLFPLSSCISQGQCWTITADRMQLFSPWDKKKYGAHWCLRFWTGYFHLNLFE